ncbi:MAG: hypothetical protein FWC73_12970 [Defluviitaleaceae bacterium]|nr:hypothetical protein [Defluviitaleaceae bacterium]
MDNYKSGSNNDSSKVKTFSDMARYLKKLLPAEIPPNYSIKPMFTSIESEENIRNGILALRDLMCLFYDLLIEDGKKYEKPNSINNKADRNPSLAVDYPFIYHAKSVLLNIGYHSILNGDVLIFSRIKTLAPIICCEGMEATTKISIPKLINCLGFLNECGMYFEGLDLDAKKHIVASERFVEVTYPDNPAVLMGLKIMAIAQRDFRWKTNDEIFLRCDYRAITKDETDVTNAIRNYISPFSPEVREYILHLHQRCLEKGLNCTVKTGLKNSFLYTQGKNVIWELSSSIANGYRIFIKAPNNHLYHEKTVVLSPLLQKIIDNGYGCEGNRFCKPCEKGCRGFYIPLDDSIVNFSKDISAWIDLEFL